MTIRHFQIFTAVVDCKTMHKAAESLYISQPSVSQAIKELENHYQVTLFERYKKRLILTADGEKLLKHCRELLAQYDTLNLAMEESRRKPVLRIGAGVCVGEELLAELITGFESSYPGIRTEILVNNAERIEEAILSGSLDTGIIEGEVISQDIVLIPFYDDHMKVVASPDNPLSGKQQIAPESLGDFDIITREQGSHARNVLLNMLRAKGVPVHIKWECTNVQTIKQAVIAGQGISLLPAMATAKEAAQGRLCVLDVAGLNEKRTVHLAMHRNKHMSKELEAFLSYLRKYREEKIQQGTDNS